MNVFPTDMYQYTLELVIPKSNTTTSKLYVYSRGISLLFFPMEYSISFIIKKLWVDGYEYKSKRLNYYFLLFQRIIRRYLIIKKRAFKLLRRRELGELTTEQFLYLIHRP